MKRPETAPTGPAQGELFTDALFKRSPLVWEYLTHDTYDDGATRERSSLSIRVEGSAILLALNDQDMRQGAYTQAGSVQQALSLLEEALSKGQVTWRPWGGNKKKK